MTLERTYKTRVKRGVAYLDGLLPGWRENIEVLDLDLRSCTQCILGQVLTNFFMALRLLGLNQYQAQSMGFNIIDDPQTDFIILTECWLDELKVN